MAIAPERIAVDWGTSALRAWAISGSGEVLAEARSDKGMGSLEKSGFEPALLDLVEGWLSGPVDVVACGMVGARQGWVEAPYTPVPCDPREVRRVRAPARDPRLRVSVLGGVKQDSPADVMRGEETQIAGVLTADPGFDGVVCLPGTHTKWAQISAGEIVSFRTFMTGELFALLAHSSVLRHSIGEGWDPDAFEAAVADAMSRPEALASRFFSIRATALLEGENKPAARARLSGLLIGAELAAARPYWLGQRILIVGSEASSAPYAQALGGQGVDCARRDGDAMTRLGLANALVKLGDSV
ncbi:2-dehydro-3-deoxygalactonokinase [Ovoidimarina sediminis]|uniref:2-dehydro-3-deoxygalactonokinase n=1 Tax=Ovoidimarina sediminis TaxID=3079856 RepID=UPI00290A15B1|nr:2-dehydro-3-deoxygalactonokinase [Rhodophyticola sp. MJ-SS7]MDU8942855.1 2-dehydro-3-deoxygalactonokinase [Rhodophyticola sp. MJ-SS7]